MSADLGEGREQPPGLPPFIAFRGALDVDGLQAGEGVLLPVYEDERPLRGFPGLVDWRLHGQLSQLLLRGTFLGAQGDRCLIPSQGYLKAEALLLMGLGPKGGLEGQALGKVLATGRRALMALGVETIVWPDPALLVDCWGVEDAAKVCLSLVVGTPGGGSSNLVILGGHEAVQSLKSAIEVRAKAIIEGGALTLE